MNLSMNIMKKERISIDYIRLVDYNIEIGIQPDMTQEDWDKDE